MKYEQYFLCINKRKTIENVIVNKNSILLCIRRYWFELFWFNSSGRSVTFILILKLNSLNLNKIKIAQPKPQYFFYLISLITDNRVIKTKSRKLGIPHIRSVRNNTTVILIAIEVWNNTVNVLLEYFYFQYVYFRKCWILFNLHTGNVHT